MSIQKLEGDDRNFCFCNLIYKNGFEKLDALIINLYFFQIFIQYGRMIAKIKKIDPEFVEMIVIAAGIISITLALVFKK